MSPMQGRTTIVMDLSSMKRGVMALAVAMTGVGRATVEAAFKAEEAAARLAAMMRRWEPEHLVCGLEAQWQVRGGLDPKYATPQDRDDYTFVTLVEPGYSPRVRARMAAAFLRGWVESRAKDDEPVEVLAWHRHFPSTNVIVTREVAA